MEPDMSQPLLPIIIPNWNTWIQTLNPCEATPENKNMSGRVGKKRVPAETEDVQTVEPNLELLTLDDGPRFSETAASTREYNYMAATHLSQCLERLAILEAEIFQLKAKENKLEHDLGLANTKIEQQFRGQLMELLEEELNCAICSDILIEPLVVDCGHVFCFHCITVWIEQRRIQSNNKPPCPTCRTEMGSLRKVRVYAGFFGRVYSLLSRQTQENRKKVLEQRQRERDNWEAEQLVMRVEQGEARQRREEEESLHAEQRDRAEARARQYTRHASQLIYEKVLRRFMDLELRGEAPNPSQYLAANLTRLATRVHNVPIPPGPQPVPETGNAAATGNLGPGRGNQPNISGQQRPVQAESVAQETLQQSRPLNTARRGRPFGHGAQGRISRA